jgi:hypothetical protein
VQLCAGAGSDFPRDPENFRVVLREAPSVVAGKVFDSVGPPSFETAEPLPAGSCRRGLVSFVVPAGAHPIAVRYAPFLAGTGRTSLLPDPVQQYEWEL